jgi:hypothetical protein
MFVADPVGHDYDYDYDYGHAYGYDRSAGVRCGRYFIS